jgi:cell division protein FtsZ
METSDSPAAGIPGRNLVIKVVGVGGAGHHVLDQIALEPVPGVSLIAMDTDSRAVGQSSAAEKFVLGARQTRGIGAGGDPDLGRAAAQEDLARIKTACGGADLVFVITGVGGGTGSGAAPVIAQAAKESGALVLGIVALPFDFEGERRHRQAQLACHQLKSAADAVICLANQKTCKLIDDKTSMVDAFKISNELLAQGFRGIWRMLTLSGLIQVGFGDLCAATRGRHSESYFAAIEVAGENPAQQALEKLIAHPLLEGGRILQETECLLISIIGGPDLKMSEVNRLMEKISRQSENAHVIFGAAIDPSFLGRLGVTVIASKRPERETPRELQGTAKLERETAPAQAQSAPGFDTEFMKAPSTVRTPSRFVAPPPVLSAEKKEQLLARQVGGSRRKKNSGQQGQLALEIISKGRFEKSEPTIHHGEDLDVPTYIRRGVALN